MWLLPPIRQYRGKYFYFFLLLGLEGLSTLLFVKLQVNLFKVYNIANIILILTLTDTTSIRKYWYLFLISLAAVLFINQTSDMELIILAKITMQVVIFYIFLRDAATDYYKNNSLKVSFIIILLYEITLLLKSYISVRNIYASIFFYEITTAFESFIAIFFTIYKVEKSPSIKLGLGPKKREKLN